MMRFVLGPGFLGTRAPLYADVSLLLMILTAVMFTVGRQRARRGHYEAHRRLQTVAVVINSLVILGVMIASFIIYILPGIPGRLLEGTYGITTLHALIGALAMLLGVFIVLRTSDLVPKALRFKNYKPFMRAAYWLYMLATLIGVIIYVIVYAIEGG